VDLSLRTRAQIGFGVYKILKNKNLNRRAIPSILATSEAGSFAFDERLFQPPRHRQANRFSETSGLGKS
jgi:hypothetical protein